MMMCQHCVVAVKLDRHRFLHVENILMCVYNHARGDQKAKGKFMENDRIKAVIEGAKDGVGVITPSAFHNQLQFMSAADWRQASKIFEKRDDSPDYFHITDDADGKVTIHNDMFEAKRVANSTPAGYATRDALVVLGFGEMMAGAVASGGMLMPPLFAVGAVAAIGAAIEAVKVGMDDYSKADAQRGTAKADLRLSPDMTFQSLKPLKS